ncbi:MAG TPA: NAD(P)H nitroreductase [Tepidimicrobium sp.]|nr:NAD(P)H nitroreductase [Tepidimicrobium sp.]
MLELLMNRRSIRKYKKNSIEKEKIDAIIKAALTSPSGRNKKPWELIIVQDKKLLKALGATRGSASYHIQSAPLAIVVLADPSITDIWIEDTSIISVIIQLVAESLGLGSCWVQIRERFDVDGNTIESMVKDILSIPENLKVESIISIGYPDEVKDPHGEEDLPFDKIHYNRYL